MHVAGCVDDDHRHSNTGIIWKQRDQRSIAVGMGREAGWKDTGELHHIGDIFFIRVAIVVACRNRSLRLQAAVQLRSCTAERHSQAIYDQCKQTQIAGFHLEWNDGGK